MFISLRIDCMYIVIVFELQGDGSKGLPSPKVLNCKVTLNNGQLKFDLSLTVARPSFVHS